jgi:hypothetical protein
MNLSDSVTQRMIEKEWGCQWIGPKQDPKTSHVSYCGCKVVKGKSYCPEHYAKMYVKGSALVKGQGASPVQKSNRMTPEELESLFNEVVQELESEGVL